MNKQAFLSLLKNPEKMNTSDIEGLEEVLINFPYFQAAHILTAKGFKDQGKMLAGQKVRKAAVYIAERKELQSILATKPTNKITEQQKESVKPFLPPIEATTIEIPALLLNIPITTSNVEIEVKEEIVAQNQTIEIVESNEKSVTQTAEVDNSQKEKETSKYISEATRNQFFEELQKNLQSLREMKALTADGLNKIKEEKEEEKSVYQTPEKLTAEKLIESLYEIPSSLNISEPEPEEPSSLLPEKIKEHNQEEELFTSRLDEFVPSSGETLKNKAKSLNESDLLMGYLNFLESSGKKQVIQKKKTEEIIENFIKKDPIISPLDKTKLKEEQEDKAVESYKPQVKIVTESMAKIMLLQGKNDKAIEIYEQLILKNPEKKAYFTSQIEKINQQ